MMFGRNMVWRGWLALIVWAGAPAVLAAGGLRATSAPVVGGEAERGMELLRAGKPKEAAAAFRAAIDVRGPEPELYYNLAVALWRAGDGEAAETAAEQAATLSDGRYGPRRDCLVGNLRYDASMVAAGDRKAVGVLPAAPKPTGQLQPKLPQPAAGAPSPDQGADLQRSLQLAKQARTYYERGIMAAAERDAVPPELVRNLERALARIEDLKRRIEEQPKDPNQKRDNKDSDGDKDKSDDEKQKDDGQKGGEQNPDKQEKGDDSAEDDSKPDQDPEQKGGDSKDGQKPQQEDQKPGDQKPGEQKPGDQKPDEQKPGDESDRQKGEEPPKDPDGGESQDQQPPGSEREPGQTEQEPDAGGENQDEASPTPGQGKEDQKPGRSKPPPAVPGEADETKELTPEQTRRLLQQLQKVDEARRRLRAQQRKQRKPVEKDW